MSSDYMETTRTSSDADSLLVGQTFEGLSSGNDTARYGVDSSTARREQSTWSTTGDTVSAEVVTLQGRLDNDFVLSKPIQAVRVQEADGYSIYQPFLHISEFGEGPAQALENLISYMVSDSTFLLKTPEEELAPDAREQKQRYLQILDISPDQ